MELRKVYDELYGMIEDLKKQINGGGSKDYDKLDNRPKVNNITLSGNKKSSDLKIAYSMTESEYAAATKNAESIYCLQENAGTLTDSAYVNLEVADWVDVSGVYKQTQPFVFEVTPAAGWTIEDVSIETGIATVDSYEVTEDPFGLSITYAAETLPEYGITATVTVTINQPAGITRIVKNGVQFGGLQIGANETVIGTWVDGRPLYAKYIDTNASIASYEWGPITTIANASGVVDIILYVKSQSEVVSYPAIASLDPSNGTIEAMHMRDSLTITFTNALIIYTK